MMSLLAQVIAASARPLALADAHVRCRHYYLIEAVKAPRRASRVEADLSRLMKTLGASEMTSVALALKADLNRSTVYKRLLLLEEKGKVVRREGMNKNQTTWRKAPTSKSRPSCQSFSSSPTRASPTALASLSLY